MDLNELQIFGELILANVYITDYICVLSMTDTKPIHVYDFHEFKKTENEFRKKMKVRELQSHQCLNGITVNDQSRVIITGKHWYLLFELDLVTKH